MKFSLIDISNMPILILKSKIYFMKYLSSSRPKLAPKLKLLRICWNLVYLIFQVCQFQSKCKKKIIKNKKFTTCQAQMSPKIENAHNWFQFCIFDISNIPISILMSKIIFITPVRPRLVPKLKMLRIHWNLAHLIFQIYQLQF